MAYDPMREQKRKKTFVTESITKAILISLRSLIRPIGEGDQ